MTELHLTVTTGKAFAGAAGRFTVTDVRLELIHRVEVTLADVAPIQSREVVRRLLTFVAVYRTRRVRSLGTGVNLFDVHL